MYRHFAALALTGAFCLVCQASQAAQAPASIEIPAFTAYVEPDAEGIAISDQNGASGWTDPKQKLVWYGYIKDPGILHPSVKLRLAAGQTSEFKLMVEGKSSSAVATGEGASATTISFKDVHFAKPGYYSFSLEGIKKSAAAFGDVLSLNLVGEPATTAHFNLKERRNAASVHLIYPLPTDAKVTWFYNEVTVKTDPIWSYYMACGFRRGYFGIQVNSPTERRVIFSIWDSGNEGVDRDKVAADDRVQLLAKGDGVFAGGFGNEGTGGHSHLIYPWKTGGTYRFLVSAEPDGTHTVYSGYFYFPEKQAWGLIARFRAPKDGHYLSGLYSFNENFGGANGQKRRLAEFGNQWVKSADGVWTELTTAKFSHDGTGKADRLDYASGTINNHFYLSNGGFFANGVKFGDIMHRSGGGTAPTDIVLPVVANRPQ